MRSSSSIFKEDLQNLQNEQKCPITQKPFQDPVVAMDGYTYERKAILEWFEKNQTSPTTKQSLASKLIIPNHSFKNMITNLIPSFMTSYERKREQMQGQIQKLQEQESNYENIIQQIIVKQSNKTEQLKEGYQKKLLEKERQIQQIKLSQQNQNKRNQKQFYQLKERYQKEIQQLKQKNAQIDYERQIRQLQNQIEYLKLNQNPMRRKQQQIVDQKDEYQKQIKEVKQKDQNDILGMPKKRQKIDLLIANNNKIQKEDRKLVQKASNQQNNLIKKDMNKNLQINILKKQSDYELSQISLNSLLRQSSILGKEGLQLLIQWLVKPITRIYFKFKASTNDFRMNKFYETCGDLNNIIIIARTTKDRIIGGYTPLSFNPSNNMRTPQYQKIYDKSNSSFLFTLSEKEKFQLKKDNYAITRWRDKKAIQFCMTFQIKDNSDTGKNSYGQYSYFDLGKNHYNTSKYPHSKQNYLKITGQYDVQFLTQQWQVYQVIFQ